MSERNWRRPHRPWLLSWSDRLPSGVMLRRWDEARKRKEESVGRVNIGLRRSQRTHRAGAAVLGRRSPPYPMQFPLLRVTGVLPR